MAPNPMLVAAEGYERVTDRWFSPEFWGDQAVPVSSGGRGGAWFVESDLAPLVLRHYRRGGLMASLSERTYLFTGYERTRSIAEFRLLLQLKALDLPVPEPVAATVWKHMGLWYRAAILVRRIPGAVTLPEVPSLQDQALWQQLGLTIRRFHDQGVNHVDLNCDNILVANNQIFLIDFDRCKLEKATGEELESSWRKRNLDRLRRSVDKRCLHLSAELRDKLWQSLLVGYDN